MLYALARPLLFALDPEVAHRISLGFSGFSSLFFEKPAAHPVRFMGLEFPNPVGLAAGLDKNGEHVDALAALGFGFLEVGTVTPRPQPGNPRPRLFRIPEREALINRMGFNNVGADAFAANLARASYRGVLGVNIGKNATTPLERAAEDYEQCLEKLYTRASYVTVNVSSPNTPGLRELQARGFLDDLLSRLKSKSRSLAERHGKIVPLVLKISPDLEPPQIRDIADAARRHHIDGLIATNTSLGREGVEGLPHADEAGGLSGAPIRAKATRVLKMLAEHLKNEIPVIASGGIIDGQDAAEKFAAGAALVQLYTGLVYRGPGLIAACVPRSR